MLKMSIRSSRRIRKPKTINNVPKQKIIFLDIDGPIINTPLYYISPECSLKRSVMNTQAIGYVKRLCDISGAKVVVNSTHNNEIIENRTVKDDLILWGLSENCFHENWKTEYPYPKNHRLGDSSENRKMLAILNWLEQNGDSEWVCFDDTDIKIVPVTEHFRHIKIDFNLGIDYTAFRKASKVFGFRKDKGFLILEGNTNV